MSSKRFPGPEAEAILDLAEKYYATNTMGSEIVPEIGRGSIITDVDGHEIICLCCDAGTNNLGFCHPKIVEAMIDQVKRLPFAELHYAPHKWAMYLARELALRSPVKKPSKVFFSNSGTEANEAARKLCEAYRQKTNTPHRQKAIYFKNGFAGRTKGSIAGTSSNPEAQQGPFLSFAEKMNSIYWPYPRIGEDWSELKKEIDNTNFLEVDRLLMEVPCQGEGGINPVDEDALKYIYKKTQKAGVIFIADCVQTGMGRVGTLFGCDVFSWLKPDILNMSKALGGGGVYMGATIFREDLDWPKKGMHSNTGGGNPLSSRAAYTALFEMEKLLADGACKKIEKILDSELRKLLKYDIVVDTRGRGAMWGVEFKTPAIRDGVVKAGEQLVLEEEFGLRLLGAGQKTIRIMPPLVITEAELRLALKLFEKAIQTLV